MKRTARPGLDHIRRQIRQWGTSRRARYFRGEYQGYPTYRWNRLARHQRQLGLHSLWQARYERHRLLRNRTRPQGVCLTRAHRRIRHLEEERRRVHYLCGRG